jgi:acetyltransferase-like isoleucine patch superfamily enzyme
MFGVALGDEANIGSKLYFYNGEGSKCVIGKHFEVNSGDNFNPLSSNIRTSIRVEDNALLIIGDWCGISSGTIWATESIKIGSCVNIGANCIIMDGDMHNIDWKIRFDDRINIGRDNYNSKPIQIDDHAWIGTGCIVLKGVHIGERSIIGAGSVVTHDIPADCIAVGNPCKIIKALV